MPESLNICCLFDEVSLDRSSAFLKLFAVDPSWMGRPSQFMVLGIKTAMMTQGDWPLPDSVVQQLLNEHLLFVYSNWVASPIRFRSSISLKERNGRAVYTLGFPVLLLNNNMIANVERQFFHIYEIAASIGKCSILIGPELEVQLTQSAREAISSALDPNSLATWIIAPEEILPDDARPFEMITKDNGVVLLRHPDAARRIGLSLTVV